MAVQVPLRGGPGRGKYAVVDEQDFPLVSTFNWHYRDGYAITKKNGRDLRMHRLIADVHDPSVLVDHKDRNRLNNTRDNLRSFTPKENANNRSDNRRIQAFGEWLTIAEWADDPRCEVSYDVLYGRIRKGIVPTWAILAPPEVV